MPPAILRNAFPVALGLSLLLAACAPATTPAPTQAPAKPAVQSPAPTAAPTAAPTKAPAAAPAPTAAPAKKADDYPNKPVKLLLPAEAAGSLDRMTRGLAPFLSKELGVPVPVENMPGAMNLVGINYFLQQPDDGYIYMVNSASPFTINLLLQGTAKFTLDDFAYINGQWTDWAIFVVGKDKPYKTLKDLIDDIKARPKKVSASTAYGSAGQVLTMILMDALKIPLDTINVVSYEGGGPALTAVVAGQVDFAIHQAEATAPQREMLRALAVVLEKPHPDWDAPPVNEVLAAYNSKLPLLSGSMRTLQAQATFKKKYPERFDKFVAAYRRVLDSPEYKQWLQTNKMGGDWIGPERTTEVMKTQYAVLEQYKDLWLAVK